MVKVTDRIRDWIERNRLAREVAELSSRDVTDLGLSREELNVLTRMPSRVRERMEAMARVFGADPRDIYLERWRNIDLAMACHNCAAVTECAVQLSRPTEARAENCGFCPNAAAYRTMARRHVPDLRIA